MITVVGQVLRMVVWVRPYWGDLIKVGVFGFSMALVAMLPPLLLKWLFDTAYPIGDASLAQALVLGITATGIVQLVFSTTQALAGLYAGGRIGNALSLTYFNHVQHLPMSFLGEGRVGELTSRAHDIRTARDVITRLFNTVLQSVILLVLVPPILLLIDVRLALLALATLPATAVVTGLAGGSLRKRWKVAAEANAEVDAYQVEILRNMETYKAMGLERVVFTGLSERLSAAWSRQFKAGWWAEAVKALSGLLGLIATGAYMWYGWMLVIQGELTIGSFLAFGGYLALLYGPIAEIVSFLADVHRASVGVGRVFDYLEEEPEQPPESVTGSTGVRWPAGPIEAVNLSFGYPGKEELLHDVSFRCEPGIPTAIVGPSGNGKTTVLKLLLGIERATRGAVSASGRPILREGLGDWRRSVAVVWQGSGIVSGSAHDNLTLGCGKVSRAEISDAIGACALEELLARLPRGLDSDLGEAGARISAGERQRFLLARAILRRAPFVFLDEATGNLDDVTAETVVSALLSRLTHSTVVLVTHQTKIASLASQLLRLESGRMIEEPRGLPDTSMDGLRRAETRDPGPLLRAR